MLSKYCRQFVSPSGLNVLVGKHSVANDWLSLTYAHKDDTWLHVSDWTGSHVVIENNNFTYNSKEDYNKDLRFAGSLAVKYSKARDQTNVKVDVCRVSQLIKEKDFPSGMVAITNNYIKITI